jgi:hypothetical protein
LAVSNADGPMNLPNPWDAIVDDEKARDYLLSATHPIGRLKAAFFLGLGYRRDEWRRLQADLLALARSDAATLGRFTRYGNKYEFRGTLNGPAGRSARVVTVWIVRHGERFSAVHHRIPEQRPMKFNLLDTVVLERDLPELGLRRGDLGAVVEVHEPDGLEVEFVRASGRPQALVELAVRDVRSIGDEDLITVRRS